MGTTDDRQNLGLAAEYAVASELCRKNIYAQLTLGLRKRTDILVATETTILKIQVKGRRNRNWQRIKGIYGEDMFLIFVDYENKQEKDRLDFYILNFEDWKKLTENIIKNYNSNKYIIKINDHYEISYTKVGETKPIYQGVEINLNHIAEFEGLWNKIEDVCR
jgi:hypothetical protein